MAYERLDYINIIDLEATCWEGNAPAGEQQEIIEIGIVQYNVKLRTLSNEKSYLVTPMHSKVSPFCTRLTTLTQEKVQMEGYHFIDAIEALKREFKISDCPWASWGDWDRKQFVKNCKLYDIPYPFGATHFNLKTLFALRKGLSKGVGVTEAIEKLGLKFEGTHHRGLDDAINIGKIATKLFAPLE